MLAQQLEKNEHDPYWGYTEADSEERESLRNCVKLSEAGHLVNADIGGVSEK